MKKAIQWIKRHDKNRSQNPQSSKSKLANILKFRYDHGKPAITEDPHNSFLERLPMELLLTVTEHLDNTSKACLKYTSRGFRSIIRIDVANMDRCTKWLIMIRLEEDAMLNTRQWKKVQTMACAICKTKKEIIDFAGQAYIRGRYERGYPRLRYVSLPSLQKPPVQSSRTPSAARTAD